MCRAGIGDDLLCKEDVGPRHRVCWSFVLLARLPLEQKDESMDRAGRADNPWLLINATAIGTAGTRIGS